MSVIDAPVAGGAAPTPERKEDARSLRSLVLRGSVWTIAGYGASSVLRLGSNLVLARLLSPGAFGLMGMVMVTLQALEMFSDLGIMPSLVRTKHGKDPRFVNTAWTLQAVRGMCLWCVTWAIAWPAASFYDQPALVWLVPAAGLSALISGFNSTSLAMLNRRLSLGKVTVLNLGTQLFSTAITIAWALAHPTVWALVAGAVAAALFKLAASHLAIRGIRARFRWDAEARRELIRFGRWIFISTVLGFLAARIDRLVLGKYMEIGQFGLFTTAIFLATYPGDLLGKIADSVLFPAFSRLARTKDNIRSQFLRAKLAQCCLVLPPLVVLVVCGPLIIELLYDDRYLDAGWMLRLIAVSEIGFAVTGQIRAALLARGDSFALTVIVAVRVGAKSLAILIGGMLAGTTGMVAALMVAPLVGYPAVAWGAHRHKLWFPWWDLAAIAAAGAGVGIGFAVLAAI